MRYKKAQGISINVIIVAAIALIVLVVLVAVFTGRIGLFGKGIDEVTGQQCADSDGVDGVVTPTQECEPVNVILGQFSDVTGNNVCCKKVGS